MSAPVRLKLPDNEARRFLAMCERLASDQAGEVVAAGAALTRFLVQRNLSWADVLHAEPAPAADPMRHWSDAASDVLGGHNPTLNAREREFLTGILKNYVSGKWLTLTPKQSDWLAALARQRGVPEWQ